MVTHPFIIGALAGLIGVYLGNGSWLVWGGCILIALEIETLILLEEESRE